MIAFAKMLRKLLESYLNRVSVLYFTAWDVRFTARNIDWHVIPITFRIGCLYKTK